MIFEKQADFVERNAMRIAAPLAAIVVLGLAYFEHGIEDSYEKMMTQPQFVQPDVAPLQPTASPVVTQIAGKTAMIAFPTPEHP